MLSGVRFEVARVTLCCLFGVLLAGCGGTHSAVTLSTKSTPLIDWATPAAIPYGTVLSAAQLNAATSVPGTFTYTPSLGAVLPAGTHTLSVTFTPTDATDYSTDSASVALTVNQATPQITWEPAGLIAAGMALGSSQLNATATAPGGTTELAGSFLYTPPAGTIFNSTGAQTFSVTFTPADTADYTTVDASVTLTVAAFGVAAWGDSLTSGFDGITDEGDYPSLLQKLIVLPVENLGVSGQTSTQIGVREGGIPAYVTVTGGSIPATGVRVTFPTGYEPVTLGGPAGGVTGSILGVHGTVTLATGVYTFTPTASGSAASAPGSPQFVVDTPHAGYLPVFWEGRNNPFAESQVLSDIAAQVATVPSKQDYLVMSIINTSTSSEWIGGSSYLAIISLNNQLANTYGSHYLDIRHVLVSSYDPAQITDVSDYQHDDVPTSLHAIAGSGKLSDSIGLTDTSFAVNLTTGSLVAGFILTIDTGENAENVKITDVSGSTVTVVRNYGGLNTSHAAGAPVTETDAIHLNAQGYQVVANAVAQYLSAHDNSKP
jgi:lysophospholipase L1-like esterase